MDQPWQSVECKQKPPLDRPARPRDGLLFTAVVMAVFLAIGVFTIATHEMWRDELQAWGIARESTSFGEVLHNSRYESHPALWFSVLYVITRFTDQPWVMQAAHFALAAAAALLFLRLAPFTRLQKALFVLGFFPLYEWAVISRNYGVGMLLVFGLCALYRHRWRRPLVIACLLFLLALANVYGCIIAVAFAGAMALEVVRNSDVRRSALRRKLRTIAALAIVLAGVVWSVVQINPPGDSGLLGWCRVVATDRMFLAVGRIWQAAVPLPKLFPYVRDTNILDPTDTGLFAKDLPGYVGQALGLALLVFLLFAFARRRTVFVFYAMATIGILAFTYMRYMGTVRHSGHHWLVFVACLWIAADEPERPIRPGPADALARCCRRATPGLFHATLVVHLLVGVFVMSADWHLPFSNSEAAAEYIQRHGLADRAIAGWEDFAVAPIAIRLKRTVYFPQGDRFGSFVLWDQKRLKTDEAALEAFLLRHGDRALLIRNSPIKAPHLREIAHFGGRRIISGEGYYMYVVRPPADPN